MTDSIHAILGEALNLYRSAMGRMVEERLRAAYKQAWWEDGVLRKLPEGMRANLRRETERLPEQERAAHIDVNHIEKIVVMNFDAVFEAVFGEFKRTQSRLATVTLARNRWAHPLNSSDRADLPADEVGHDLYDAAQLLETAKLPEATEVERLRRQALGMDAEPEAQAIRQVRPTGPKELPYWLKTDYSRWEPFFAGLTGRRHPFSFAELEAMIPGGLPPSASRHRAWWSNGPQSRHAWAGLWLKAGWKARLVDRPGGPVTFTREG